jgi:hypothetical protein
VNLFEAVELLNVVSDFNFKDSENIPNISIYDNGLEGFVLCVKANLVNEEYRDFLKGIVESRKLGVRELEGYLIVYGY